MIKSKIRQLKRKETKKGKSHSDVESLNNSAAPSPMGVVSPPDHSAETKDDGVTADVNQEGQVPPEGKKKRKMTKKKENGKVEGEKVSFLYLLYYLCLIVLLVSCVLCLVSFLCLVSCVFLAKDCI